MSRLRSSSTNPVVRSAGRSAAGHSCRVALGEQVAQHDVLLGGGEQPRRRQAARGVGQPQHAERVGVDGAGDRLADGAPQPGGDPVAQFARGAPAERQQQQVLDRYPRLDPGHRRLDERGGLARARTGQDEQRPPGVLDDPALRGV